MRRLVLRSIEDETGQRCVDIYRDGARFGWTECRRDPEDGHGWRHLAGMGTDGFGSEAEATDAARAAVAWLEGRN